MFNFDAKNDAQVAEMLKEAVRMVRESEKDGFRYARRVEYVDEVAAECQRRGINVSQVALAA